MGRVLAALVAIAALGVPGVAAAQDAPAPEPESAATITVTPNVDLVDHQVVRVTGSGFAPHQFVDLLQCQTGGHGFSGCVFPPTDDTFADAHGAFTTTVGLSARLSGFLLSSPVDCRPVGTCELRAKPESGGAASVGLNFDPAAPLADPPILTVTPNTGLVDGQLVLVEGSGFRPGGLLFVIICEGTVPTAQRCPDSAGATDDDRVDADGNVSTEHRVRALISVGQPSTVVDCRVSSCFLSASEDPFGDDLPMVPLQFDPDAPLLPPPTVTADPSTGLHDGQVIEVHGTGWTPQEAVLLLQCEGTAPFSDARCSDGPFTPNFVGNGTTFAGSFTVAATFATDEDHQVHCLTQACSLVAFSTTGSGAETASTPLSFVADPPTPPATPTAVQPRFTG